MPDNTDRINEIEAILRAGAKRVSLDGVTIDYDFAALRAELRQLKATDPSYRAKRPAAARIHLGGF